MCLHLLTLRLLSTPGGQETQPGHTQIHQPETTSSYRPVTSWRHFPQQVSVMTVWVSECFHHHVLCRDVVELHVLTEDVLHLAVHSEGEQRFRKFSEERLQDHSGNVDVSVLIEVHRLPWTRSDETNLYWHADINRNTVNRFKKVISSLKEQSTKNLWGDWSWNNQRASRTDVGNINTSAEILYMNRIITQWHNTQVDISQWYWLINQYHPSTEEWSMMLLTWSIICQSRNEIKIRSIVNELSDTETLTVWTFTWNRYTEDTPVQVHLQSHTHTHTHTHTHPGCRVSERLWWSEHEPNVWRSPQSSDLTHTHTHTHTHAVVISLALVWKCD